MSNIENNTIKNNTIKNNTIKNNTIKNNTTILENNKNDTKEDDILLLPKCLPPLTRTCGVYKSCDGKEPCGSTRCYLLTIKNT